MTSIEALEGTFAQFHQAFLADGYTITIRDPNGSDGFNISKRAALPDPLDPKIVVETILKYGWSALCKGWSPIARPRSTSRTIFQIDDLSCDAMALMINDGWRPCYTQQTSPTKFQAALAVNHVDDATRLEARRRLIAHFGADPGATGAYRLPGFQNGKLKYRRDDGTYPRVEPLSWSGENCPMTGAMIENVRADFAEQSSRIQTIFTDTDDVDIASLDDLSDAWQRLEHHAYRACGRLWKSEHDWMMSIMLRCVGATEEEVAQALEYLSPRHGLRSKNDAGFELAAVSTAERAFGQRGDEALQELAGFHWQWERDISATRS